MNYFKLVIWRIWIILSVLWTILVFLLADGKELITITSETLMIASGGLAIWWVCYWPFCWLLKRD